MPKPLLIRWLLVCLLPLFTIAYFIFNPAEQGSTRFLINGIILACECAFLFKYILFALIGHHLRGEHAHKQHTAWQFTPLILFIAYICHYFGLF